jgi:hypothetical protein
MKVIEKFKKEYPPKGVGKPEYSWDPGAHT